MRRQLLDALDAVPRAGFLCFIVGPAISPGAVPNSGDAPAPDSAVDSRSLLEAVRDRLRDGPGVNAFLADDLPTDLAPEGTADSVGAPDEGSERGAPAPRSVRLARASNAVAVVAPSRGVDARTAAVLADARRADAPADRLERLALVHETERGSGTTASLAGDRSVTVHSYADVDELDFQLRAFVARVMHQEMAGELATPA